MVIYYQDATVRCFYWMIIPIEIWQMHNIADTTSIINISIL